MTPLQQQLIIFTKRMIKAPLDTRMARVVPSVDGIKLAGGAANFNGVVLYADLADSSRLATEFRADVAAKIFRAYLFCMTKLIREHQGTVTSFDGDRVMGIFIGDDKEDRAGKCAFEMTWVVQKVLAPAAYEMEPGLRHAGLAIKHGCGIDSGQILAVRGGAVGNNDVVWVGRSPNLAAKLSSVREPPHYIYASDSVFRSLSPKYRFGPQGEAFWELQQVPFGGENVRCYRSHWMMEP